MNIKRKELLESLLKSGISNILIRDINLNDLDNSVTLESECNIDELVGHYEGIKYVAPIWYQNLIKLEQPILIIKDINKINEDEQRKFIEILKYKKISTFELPTNCLIIVTLNSLYKNKIEEEISKLVAKI